MNTKLIATLRSMALLTRTCWEDAKDMDADELKARPMHLAEADAMADAADTIEQPWISAATLPPHGVPVLAYYRNELGKSRVVRATYYGPMELEQADECGGPGDYDEKSDEYYAPEGWYETNEHEETYWRVDETVTHWMRLPDPPCDDEATR
jgi:hypothetical protein